MIDVKNVLLENALLIEKKLEFLLSEEKIGKGKLADAMRYSTLGGGKRIRASLALETCRMFSSNIDRAMNVACAIEMIHAYSLIHDDLPCMDNDDMRRGKPSCHKAFDESTALLAGNSLYTYAFECILEDVNIDSAKKEKMLLTISKYLGVNGVMGGQELDTQKDIHSFDELINVHKLKTGVLIQTSLICGYYASGVEIKEDVLSSLERYGLCLGLAFQIEDDLLDYIQGEKKEDEINICSFISLEQAKDLCEKYSNEAKEIISKFDKFAFLAALPEYLCSRKS